MIQTYKQPNIPKLTSTLPQASEHQKVNVDINKKFWEQLIACFPLIRHGPQRKRRAQQLFYCYVRIRCCGNVFTEPLPSNDMGIHI
jgi:hypothetical protein